MTTDTLLEKIREVEKAGCSDKKGRSLLTLLDLRTENFLKTENPIPHIKYSCKTITCLLDDLRDPKVRSEIPLKGLVVTVTETGNRDTFAIAYLHTFGYRNLKGLRFGMRDWIKKNYPVETVK